MSYLVLMAHDGNLDFAPIAEKSYRFYADMHGYDFDRRYFMPLVNGHGHPSWQKLHLLHFAMAFGEWDWILWADTDSVITNYRKRLEDFIEKEKLSNPWLIVSRDWSDASPWSAGVMLIRNCEEAKSFLLEAQSKTQYQNSGCWDQSAMHKVWKDKPDGIAIVPRRYLQSVPKECSDGVVAPWQTGDFIAHVTGIPSERKLPLMKNYFDRAIR